MPLYKSMSRRLKPEKDKELNYAQNEAIKALRTNITFCGNNIKTIAITSSVPHEGKTTISYYLADAFAQAGKKVLLIEADNRKASLGSRIGITNAEIGLSHVLSGISKCKDSVYEIEGHPNLYIMFAGPLAPNPTELLDSRLFDEMLAAAQVEYDIVLVDCPPLGAVIDAAIVAKRCDGAILVIESGVTSYHIAQESKEQLTKSGCRILGVVLNKTQIKGKSYGKYSRYGKYGKYGQYGRYDRGA